LVEAETGTTGTDAWDADTVPAPILDVLLLDIDGFEGPIDVLLALSRDQKVDLRQISILQLAEQYLHFVHEARQRNLELAADYLVMAAWLAYLKSRLLLPAVPDADEPSGATWPPRSPSSSNAWTRCARRAKP